MDGDIDRVPLSRLSDESKNLLSSLLNTKKVLKNVCSDRISRYRDWRGLASLINLSAQVEVSINDYPDKFERLLEIWLSRDKDATVGELLSHLQLLDRFDVYDDLIDLSYQNKLIAPPPRLEVARVNPSQDLITIQDVEHDSPQTYHAYVLYAQQDRDFVENMLRYLRDRGLRLCTEDDLMPGFSTLFEPVARLISQRCHRIILVYSPDFFASNAVKFITHFAQAHGVESNIQNLLPIMYRFCTLPPLLAHYHNLTYPQSSLKAITDGVDDNPYRDTVFWSKLEKSLGYNDTRRIRNVSSASSEHSNPRIQLASSTVNGYATPQHRPESSTPNIENLSQDGNHSRFTPQKKEKQLLQLPEPPSHYPSAISLPDSIPSSLSETSSEVNEPKSMMDLRKDKKSKKNSVERFFSQVRSFGSKIGGKKKKAIMVEN